MKRIFDCDPGKRARLAQDRKFDLIEMADVFADEDRIDFIDDRRDYGEERRATIGCALGGTFTVIYTVRGSVTWLITAWPANRKERERYARK